MIRVVVVDDSETVAYRLMSILEVEPDIRVVRHFSNADDFLLWPDLETASVVLLDVWMPGTSGLKVLRDIATRVPVIVVSEATETSDLAIETLAQGAAAFVPKRELSGPSGELRLKTAVRSAARGEATPNTPVVLIVGSTGAPRALERLLPALSDAAAAFAIVQHLPLGGETAFARWVVGLGLTARPARPGDTLRRSCALIAPAGQHMLLSGRGIRLAPGVASDVHVPSADRTMRSFANLGENVIAIVLSGMGRDGALGAAELVAKGGTCIVQHPDECGAPSMPRAAMAASPRVRAFPVDSLSRHVIEFLKRT